MATSCAAFCQHSTNDCALSTDPLNAGTELRAPKLTEAANATKAVYDRNAACFDEQRSQALFEKSWIDRLLSTVPRGGNILDVGCGSGRPIGTYIVSKGFQLTGIDFSQPMLDLAAQNLPGSTLIRADMRTLALDRTFDGIIAWNSFFHLRETEQVETLKRFAKHLNAGGHLLTTIGHKASEVLGHVGDDFVYHASLSPEGYRDACQLCGFSIVELISEDANCASHSILLAQKRA